MICKAATFGGANYLLDRCYKWLKKQNISVEQSILSEGVLPPKTHYDIAILPSYVMDDIYALRKQGYIIERILTWIMGMGCFQDGYFNPMHNSGIKGFLTKLLSVEAEKALRKISLMNSICFTDVVGRYNTYRKLRYADENFESDNLIPIGITVPYQNKCIPEHSFNKLCWVGRVAYDFKYIPLVKVLNDVENYCRTTETSIIFTIVGNGDALQHVKSLSQNLSYHIEFIEFLPYSELDAFFEKQDIAFVMGTSALDAARNYCPAVVVSPVRPGIDREDVKYRWIFESKGYSLGEYPELNIITNQVQKDFDIIVSEYNQCGDIDERCYEYAKMFDEDMAFGKLLQREWPEKIDKGLWRHIKRYYYIKQLMRTYLKAKQ